MGPIGFAKVCAAILFKMEMGISKNGAPPNLKIRIRILTMGTPKRGCQFRDALVGRGLGRLAQQFAMHNIRSAFRTWRLQTVDAGRLKCAGPRNLKP